MLSLFISITVSAATTFAASRYWVASGSGGLWTNTANWSETDGGAGGASVPVLADAVYYTSNSGSGNINTDVVVSSISLMSGYTGSIIVNTSQSVTAGSMNINGGLFWAFAGTTLHVNGTVSLGGGDLYVAGSTFYVGSNLSLTGANSTFNGGSVPIEVYGNVIISNGEFISTSDILSVAGNFSYNSGTFTHSSGTVTFTGSIDSTLSLGSAGVGTFNNLIMSKTSATSPLYVAAGDTATVVGALTLTSGKLGIYETGELIAAGTMSFGASYTGIVNSSYTGFLTIKTTSNVVIPNGETNLPSLRLDNTNNTNLQVSTLGNTAINFAGNFEIATGINGGAWFTNSGLAPLTFAGTFTINNGIFYTGAGGTSIVINHQGDVTVTGNGLYLGMAKAVITVESTARLIVSGGLLDLTDGDSLSILNTSDLAFQFINGEFRAPSYIGIVGGWDQSTPAVFTHNSKFVTFYGSTDSVINTSSTLTFYGLEIQKTGGTGLLMGLSSSSLNVTGPLNLTDGKIGIPSGRNITASGTISWGSGFDGNYGDTYTGSLVIKTTADVTIPGTQSSSPGLTLDNTNKSTLAVTIQAGAAGTLNIKGNTSIVTGIGSGAKLYLANNQDVVFTGFFQMNNGEFHSGVDNLVFHENTTIISGGTYYNESLSSVYIGADDTLTISGGTMNCTGAALLRIPNTASSAFALTSGTFIAPTLFELFGGFTQSASGTTYTNNGGSLVLKYSGVTAQTFTIPATTSLADLEINLSGGASLSIPVALTTTGLLRLTDGSLTGAGSLSINGEIIIANTFDGVGVAMNIGGSSVSAGYLQGSINGAFTLNNPNMVVGLSDSTVFGSTVNITQGTLKTYVADTTDPNHVVASVPVVVNTVFTRNVTVNGGILDANITGEANPVIGAQTFSQKFIQNGGTFTALSITSLSFDSTDTSLALDLNAGSFITPTATMYVKGGIDMESGFSFTANSGTVEFNGTIVSNIKLTATPPAFNNLTINKTLTGGYVTPGSEMGTAGIPVEGVLHLQDGGIAVSSSADETPIVAKGTVVWDSTFDGKNGTAQPGTIRFETTADVIIPDGAPLVRLVMNSAGRTLKTSGTTPLTFPTYSSLTVNAGTFDNLFNANIGFYKLIQGGGIINLGTGATHTVSVDTSISGGTLNLETSSVSANNLVMNGGTLNALNATLLSFDSTSATALDLNAGSLITPNATMYVTGGIDMESGFTFTADNGTVEFNGTTTDSVIKLTATPPAFNNVTINKTSSGAQLIPDIEMGANGLIVNGVLHLQEGGIAALSSSADETPILARGTVVWDSTFDGINGSSIPGTIKFETTGDIVIPNGAPLLRLKMNSTGRTLKTSGTASLSFPAYGSLTVTNGTFDNEANVDINFYQIIQSGGAITLGTGASHQATSGSSFFSLTGGTLNAETSSIDITGFLAVAGGSFSSTSGAFTTVGNLIISNGSFTAGSGIYSLGAVYFSGGSTDLSAASSRIITGTLDARGGVGSSFTLGSGTTTVGGRSYGDTLTTYGALGTIEFNGSGNNYLSGYLPYENITINKTNSTDIMYGDDVDITAIGDIIVKKGKLNVNAKNITVGGNWAVCPSVALGDVDCSNASVGDAEFIPGTQTVTFNGTNQTIYGSNDHTFYNFTKVVSATETLTFEAGQHQVMTGTTTLQGVSGGLLSLRSTSPGSYWYFDPQGTRVFQYLDTQDSYNHDHAGDGLVEIDTTGLFVVDSGNNVNWIFPGPPIITNLRPPEYVDGTANQLRQPTLTFDIDDQGDFDVNYRIQIDNDWNFTSPVLDFTSDFFADPNGNPAGISYTVGEGILSQYNVGAPGQTLSDGNYFWRVMSTNSQSAMSTWETVNEGVVDFVVDNIGPTDQIVQIAPKNNVLIYSSKPTYVWTQIVDDGGGYILEVVPADALDFSDVRMQSFTAPKDATSANTAGPNLLYGDYKWRIYAVDEAGNFDATGSDPTVATFSVANMVPEFSTYMLISVLLSGMGLIYWKRKDLMSLNE